MVSKIEHLRIHSDSPLDGYFRNVVFIGQKADSVLAEFTVLAHIPKLSVELKTAKLMVVETIFPQYSQVLLICIDIIIQRCHDCYINYAFLPDEGALFYKCGLSLKKSANSSQQMRKRGNGAADL